MAEPLHAGFVPGRHALEAYGRGGFRFAGMSHRGSILVLPSGIRAWPVAAIADATIDDFTAAIAERDSIDILLIGCGALPVPPADRVLAALREAGLRLDAMATGPAARTCNVLLAENRRVAAALVAVP